MKNNKLFSLSVLALSVSQAVYAANPNDAEMLDDVVVTATKTAKIVSDAPATVSVVSAKQIANKNAHRVEEALAGTPGVFIRDLGGEQPSNYLNQITLRGIPGYYRTGVLVDGVSINNAFSGGVNMSAVPVDDIKQIEIVPGAFSSLYGGSGMAGVINIITKTPEKREISIKGDGGSHNFKSLNLGYRDKLSEMVGLSFSYGRKQSDGYVDTFVTKVPTVGVSPAATGWQQTSTNLGAPTYVVGDKGRQGWTQDNYGAKFFLTLSPVSKLTLDTSYLTHQTNPAMGGAYLTRLGVPVTSGLVGINGKRTTLNATDFLQTTTGEDMTRLAGTYETLFGEDYKFKTSLSYQNNNYWYTSITANPLNVSGPGTLADIPNKKLDGDVQLSFPVGSSQYVVVGASANSSTLNKKVYALANWRAPDVRGLVGDWANGNSQSMAVYAQDEFAVSDKLTVYGGARYDTWSTDGTININAKLNNYATRTSTAFNPKASAVYKFDEGTILKAAIGKAFRAPNLSDMYSTFGTATVFWSNPSLKPELVTTAEIGLEHAFATGTLLRGTVYQSDISDLIYTSTAVGGNSYKFNAGKALANGIDLEARQKLNDGLTAFLNATFVSTKITENAIKPLSVGHQIPLQAKRMANIGIEGNHGAWAGSLTGSYVGKMYNTDDNTDYVNNVIGSYDAYFIVNAKVSYKFDKSITASLSINNLLGRSYFQNLSKADGRSFYLGLGFKY